MPGDTWTEWEDGPDNEDATTTPGGSKISTGLKTEFVGGDTQFPTSTSNPQRPRTVAAKFNAQEQAIYVVMRPYRSSKVGFALYTPVVKYWPCDALEWNNFRRAYSKGRYIALNWDNQINYQDVGDAGDLDMWTRSAINYARTQQRIQEGIVAGQSTGSDIYKKLRKAVQEGRRVTDVRLRSDRKGGTGRTREQKAALERAEQLFYRNKP